MVLDALSHHPFEPLKVVGMKFVSLKVALLLALTAVKCVSDLQALSVHPSCLQFAPGEERKLSLWECREQGLFCFVHFTLVHFTAWL